MKLDEIKARHPELIDAIETQLVWMKQDIKQQPENADYIRADYDTTICSILWEAFQSDTITEAEHKKLYNHYTKRVYR